MALVPVTIKTPEGDFESLALGDPVATPAKVGKADKTSKSKDQLDDMLDILSTLVRATYKDWMAAMQEFGRGYSETSFNRKLAELKKQGRVTGGGAQGEYYSVVPSGPSGASASVGPGAAVQPDEMQPEHPIPTTPAKPLPPLPPLKGVVVVGVLLGAPNHTQDLHGGGGVV